MPGRGFYNFGPWNFYQRPDKRYTGGGFANVELSKAIKPYVEVMYMNDRSVAQVAPSGDFGTTENINCDNPLLSDQQRALFAEPAISWAKTPSSTTKVTSLESRAPPSRLSIR